MFATSSDNNRFTDDHHVSNGESIRSGARWFLGSSTLLHASTDFHANYEAGLTQYNLSAGPDTYSQRSLDKHDESNRTFIFNGQTVHNTFKIDPSPELLVGFPLFGNHSIQGRCSYAFSNQRLRTDEDVIEDDSMRGQAFGLAWVWDTTDDPILRSAALSGGRRARSRSRARTRRWERFLTIPARSRTSLRRFITITR